MNFSEYVQHTTITSYVTGPVAWDSLPHRTFVPHLHVHYQRSKTCSRHIFSHVPTSLTNCFQSTSSRNCTAPL